MAKLDFHIDGMHCGSCAVGIQMLTSQMEGVKSAEVSYESKKGTFEFDESKVKKEDLIKSMKELGYTATEATG